MYKVLLFAGTTEGRLLCDFFHERQIAAVVCVATEYGENILTKMDGLKIIRGRLNEVEMGFLMKEQNISLVVDATHPYAALVSDNIKEACYKNNIPCIRLLRESLKEDGVLYFSCVEAAVEYLNKNEEPAFITTGSNELEKYTSVKNYKERLTVRVLPEAGVIKKCTDLGFKGKKLICMQGPFSQELNELLIKETGASYLVTKEAGSYGGFLEKVRAAKKAGARILVVERPRDEKGYTMEQVKEIIKKESLSDCSLE